MRPRVPAIVYASVDGVVHEAIPAEPVRAVSPEPNERNAIVPFVVVEPVPQVPFVVVEPVPQVPAEINIPLIGGGDPRNRPSVLFNNTSSEKYTWLPPGWIAEERTRVNGRIDMYFYDPEKAQYRSVKCATDKLIEQGYLIDARAIKRRVYNINRRLGRRRRRRARG